MTRRSVSVLPDPICAISLDFANTLYPFRVAETDQSLRALHDFLQKRLDKPLGYAPFAALYHEIRTRQFTDNRATLRENDFTARIRECVEFCQNDTPADPALVREAEDVYADGFVSVMHAPDGLRDTLSALADKFPLAVLSNFPRTDCIVRPLERDGLLPFFQGVVVSADIGYIKPHAALFEAVCGTLKLPPAHILHVGDDWDADILGAARAGLPSAYTHEWRDEPDAHYGTGGAAPLFEINSLSGLLSRHQENSEL